MNRQNCSIEEKKLNDGKKSSSSIPPITHVKMHVSVQLY
jgi:hypothetical protein